MKLICSIVGIVLVAARPEAAFAQQALKTDTAGNPLTTLNLSGSNVTGTLPSSRLPAGAGAPVVQLITAHAGSVTIAAGTTAAILTAVLDGTLTLVLPSASSYPVGRALLVVDPGGFSTPLHPVRIAVPTGNTIEGTSGPVLALTGAGTAACFTNGSSTWTGDGREQKALKNQPGGYAGLDAEGSLNTSGTSLRFQDLLVADSYGLYVNDQRMIGPNGEVYAQDVLWYDGYGDVILAGVSGAGQLFNGDHLEWPIISQTGELTSFGGVTLMAVDPASVFPPDNGVVHYVSNVDGKEYVRDAAGVSHPLW